MRHFSFILFATLLLVPRISWGQGEGKMQAFALFDGEGKRMDYQELLQRSRNSDLIFFGEIHDDPIGHWIQLRLTEDLYKSEGEALRLGGEMYEADDQLILNEYIKGRIRTKDLKREAKLWDNFSTDLLPILEFARSNSIPFLASNVPRRYAALVHRRGVSALDSLDPKASEHFVEDLKVDTGLASYQRILKMGHGENSMRLLEAQALKDATMAARIDDAYQEGELFLHFNGTFHSDAHEGIVHYLEKKSSQDQDILVISSIEVEDPSDPEGVQWERKGDVNLLVPEDMTSTH